MFLWRTKKKINTFWLKEKILSEAMVDRYTSYSKHSKISYAKVSDKIAYITVQIDETASSGAVRSRSVLFAIPLTIFRNNCIKNKI